MNTKKVTVYMRVSTENQEKEETIKNQHMELMEHISKDENAYLAPECIYKDEGWSGAILERPALDKMRADAADGKFNVLYIYDRGRLARKFVYQEIVIEELRKYNALLGDPCVLLWILKFWANDRLGLIVTLSRQMGEPAQRLLQGLMWRFIRRFQVWWKKIF